ncbi:hypothetical protein HDU98_010680 [Podochytrium sp. JEL0797]|nr:hypothetical protein HDU98_010680 [Podochytrium sp. JEL0797]
MDDTPKSNRRTVAIVMDGTVPESQFAFHWSMRNYLLRDDMVLLLNVEPHSEAPTDPDCSLGFFTKSELEIAANQASLRRYGQLLSASRLQHQIVPLSGTMEERFNQVQEIEATTLILPAPVASRNLLHRFNCPVLVVKPNVNEMKAMGYPESRHVRRFDLPLRCSL